MAGPGGRAPFPPFNGNAYSSHEPWPGAGGQGYQSARSGNATPDVPLHPVQGTPWNFPAAAGHFAGGGYASPQTGAAPMAILGPAYSQQQPVASQSYPSQGNWSSPAYPSGSSHLYRSISSDYRNINSIKRTDSADSRGNYFRANSQDRSRSIVDWTDGSLNSVGESARSRQSKLDPDDRTSVWESGSAKQSGWGSGRSTPSGYDKKPSGWESNSRPSGWGSAQPTASVQSQASTTSAATTPATKKSGWDDDDDLAWVVSTEKPSMDEWQCKAQRRKNRKQVQENNNKKNSKKKKRGGAHEDSDSEGSDGEILGPAAIQGATERKETGKRERQWEEKQRQERERQEREKKLREDLQTMQWEGRQRKQREKVIQESEMREREEQDGVQWQLKLLEEKQRNEREKEKALDARLLSAARGEANTLIIDRGRRLGPGPFSAEKQKEAKEKEQQERERKEGEVVEERGKRERKERDGKERLEKQWKDMLQLELERKEREERERQAREEIVGHDMRTEGVAEDGTSGYAVCACACVCILCTSGST